MGREGREKCLRRVDREGLWLDRYLGSVLGACCRCDGCLGGLLIACSLVLPSRSLSSLLGFTPDVLRPPLPAPRSIRSHISERHASGHVDSHLMPVQWCPLLSVHRTTQQTSPSAEPLSRTTLDEGFRPGWASRLKQGNINPRRRRSRTQERKAIGGWLWR